MNYKIFLCSNNLNKYKNKKLIENLKNQITHVSFF